MKNLIWTINVGKCKIKCLKIVHIGQKWFQMVTNSPKWSQMAPNGLK